MIDPGAFNDLPAHVRVGAYDIAIVLELNPKGEKDDPVFGLWDDAQQRIVIEMALPSRMRAANTVIHEINHAIFTACALGERDGEERICTAMANGWCQVMRDNPTLLSWLVEMTVKG